MTRNWLIVDSLKKISMVLLFVCSITAVFAQNESDFYTETNHLGITQNLVTDYGANGADANDDSQALQNAIDYLTGLTNGGKIIIPSGTFYFVEIIMKSNVHIEIDMNATIIPTVVASGNYSIFYFGSNTATVNNVSIRGSGGNFTVDLTAVANTNIRVFQCNNVNNFLFSHFDILDNDTKFAAVTMGFTEYNGNYYIPTNGIVKNATTQDAHYGYGLVQIQAGSNILYKDLSGIGGSTLRLESGYHQMNVLRPPGVGIFDVYGRNIHCEDGNSTVMFSPHTMRNGRFDVDGVTAINCGFAARVAFGFATNAQDALGLTPGSFDSTSVLTNVNAVYGTTAQLKPKHYPYMPCEITHLNSTTLNPDGESYTGPSISAVVYDAYGGDTTEGDWNLTMTNVTQNGFVYKQEAILVDSNAYGATQCASVTASFTYSNTDENFSFDGSGSDDTNGSISQWYWNFGDGTTGSGEFATHTYTTSGTYTVHLQVTDNVGATNSMLQTITATVLPVELSRFEAKLTTENQIILDWETQSELNNQGFEIQRTADNKHWETLGFVEGNGTSLEVNTYRFIDENPFLGFNYYRLKQIDFDETSDFSAVEVVNNHYDNRQSMFKIYPTLANNFIHIETENVDDLNVQIFDGMGRMLIEQSVTNTIDISTLPKGQYFIKVLVDGNWFTERFVKF